MAFYLGGILDLGKISTYNEKDKQTISFQIQPLKSNEINKIDRFFQEITSKTNNGNFGYTCIYLSWLYDNDFRKIFLLKGKQQYGFNKIQFVDEISLLYLNCIFQLNLTPIIDEPIIIVWENNGYSCKKTSGTKMKMLEFFSMFCLDFYFENNKDYDTQKHTNLIFFNDSSKMKELKNIFKNNKCHVIKENKIDEKCLLQKARFMAGGNLELSVFDIDTYIDTYNRLKINDHSVMNLDPCTLLPLEETVIVPIKTKVNKVKISIEPTIYETRLYNEEIQVNHLQNLKYPFLQFTLKIDENCVYSVHNLIPMPMKNGESEKFVNKFELRKDGYLFTFRHIITFSGELAKSRFLEKSWYISFAEKKPIYGQKAKEILIKKPTYVIYDLIKLCSITDPKEADPKWPFEVKMHKNEYIVVEFDTFNGRRKATPTFLMALFIGNIINYSMKTNKEMLRETEVRFIDIEKTDILTSTLIEAIKLLIKINDYDLNLFFL